MLDDFRGDEELSGGIPEEDGRYMTFVVQDKLFGLPISHVVQILGEQPITPVPQYPHFAKGIIDLRGEIIPVIDLRLRLGKEPEPYDDRTCFLVHQNNDQPICLIADRVGKVAYIPEVDIQPPLDPETDADWAYAWGQGQLGSQAVLLMDVDRIIADV